MNQTTTPAPAGETGETAGTSAPRLRDLDAEVFRARYATDRYTATVLGNRLEYLLDHVCSRLLTCAFSPMLRDLYDFGATITGAPASDYVTPIVGKGLAAFTGTMTESVKNTIEEYGAHRLAPGDVIISNDPYRIGTHVNDMLFCRPVFHEGEIVNFVTIKAHQLDIGGSVPGGFSATKTSNFENGLILAPLALETWALLMDNTRFGEMVGADIRTIVSCLDLGESLMTGVVSHYGIEAVTGTMQYICDIDAERMREAIRALPDGEWFGESLVDSDGLADDEEFPIRVRLHKRGDRLEVDLSGTARQARTTINSTFLDTKTAVGVALKYLLDPGMPFTSGLYRSVDIVVPDGSITNALPPDGVVFCYGEATEALITAIMAAMAPVLGEDALAGSYGSPNMHTGFGRDEQGRIWVSSGVGGGEHGPWGATKAGDADSYTLFYQANGLDMAVEVSEIDAPVAILRKEYLPDTAGAGHHRGGASVLKDTLWLAPAAHNLMTFRYKQAPGFGVRGGGTGAIGAAWVWDDAAQAGDYRAAHKVAGVFDPETGEADLAGEYAWFNRRPNWPTPARALFRYRTSGGGGWGDPYTREPSRVLEDVRNEYVSVEAARADYGVVIVGDPRWDPEGLVVDEELTAILRAEEEQRREHV